MTIRWSHIQRKTSKFRIPLVLWLRSRGLLSPVQRILTNWRIWQSRRLTKSSSFNRDALVLVVCANFNHSKWISACVESIFNQSFQNWHLVIADDQSTDRSLEVLKTWNQHPQVSIIQLSSNSGAYVARNTAIASASDVPWTHITFIDPDDVATTQWIEHGLNLIGNKTLAWIRTLLQRTDPSLKNVLSTYHGYCPTIFTKCAWELLGGFADVRFSGDTEVIERLRHLSRLDAMSDLEELFAFEVGQKCRVHESNASLLNLKQRKIWLEQRIRDIQSWTDASMYQIQPKTASYKRLISTETTK